MSGASNFARAGSPWLFAELVIVAAWVRDGDTITQIAWRLNRRIREVHAVVFGAEA